MDIELKCFATLRKYGPGEGMVSLPDGATVQQAAELLGIPLEEVKLVFVNGVRGELDAELHDRDRVGLFPPVGGG